jgi:mRNA interferase MazF
VTRGEIWWLESPDEKRRPVLLLTRSRLIHRLSAVMVAPVTTRRRNIPTEVPLDEDDGMPRPCVVALDNVRTVPQAYLTATVTALSPERMAEVCQALRIAVDC